MNRKTSRILSENKGLILFVVLMACFRSSLADWNRVPTGSMQPTIIEGDHIVVNKLAYDFSLPFTQIKLVTLGQPQRGDIVVFNSKVSQQRLVKRVIGLPGDRLEMRNNQLYINSKILNYTVKNKTPLSIELEETLFDRKHTIKVAKNISRAASFNTITVPAKSYLVLGDNRDNSADSRYIGFVPRSEIIGRSSRVAYSLNPDNFYLPRVGRFNKTL